MHTNNSLKLELEFSFDYVDLISLSLSFATRMQNQMVENDENCLLKFWIWPEGDFNVKGEQRNVAEMEKHP